MGPSITVDRVSDSLVVVTFPPKPVTDDEIRAFVEEQRAIVARGIRHFSVADASRATALPPNQRRMLADWLREAEEVTEELVIGMAIVVSNPLVRGALTAVFWLRQPPVPTRVFGTLSEAVDHALDCVEREGLPVTPRMRDLALHLRQDRPSGR